jgi:hypothetical protein
MSGMRSRGNMLAPMSKLSFPLSIVVFVGIYVRCAVGRFGNRYFENYNAEEEVPGKKVSPQN